MTRPNAAGERLFVLFLLGVFLLNPPMLSIFDVPRQVFGIPLLYLYLFTCWGALLSLVAFIIEKGNRAAKTAESRGEAANDDRTV